MKKSFIQSYYDFFDKKIEETTIVVGIIGAMIFFIGLLVNTDANYYKGNIIEYKTQTEFENVIMINGEKYKIIFQKIN